jgi:putative transposase
MKKSRSSETQIVKILEEVEAGRLGREFCREYHELWRASRVRAAAKEETKYT